MTGTLLVQAMREHGVEIWGDGSTYKGNDIERFYRYGLLANPKLRIYKPWLDSAFVGELGGRKEMSEWLEAKGPATRNLGREGVLDRRQPARRDARGEGPRAPLDEHEDRRRRSWASPTGTRRSQIEPETVTIEFEGGAPGRGRRPRARRPGRARPRRRTRSAGATGSACPTRSRTAMIEAKSRGIYEAPGMALLHIAYERLLTAIHNEATLEQYAEQGRRLGRLLYEGRWFDLQALMLRDSL